MGSNTLNAATTATATDSAATGAWAVYGRSVSYLPVLLPHCPLPPCGPNCWAGAATATAASWLLGLWLVLVDLGGRAEGL